MSPLRMFAVCLALIAAFGVVWWLAYHAALWVLTALFSVVFG